MKKQILFALAIVSAFTAAAQKPVSPPAKVETKLDGVAVTIDYHQPSAKGRKIMGGLVPFGEVWRTGANATTTIEFGSNAKIEGQAVAAGKYGLYTIPGETEWTIIINKGIKWGAYDYTEKQDVLRVKVKSSKASAFTETFTISSEDGNIVLKWENTSVAFKVTKG